MNLFDSLVDNLVEQIGPICKQIESLPIEQQVDTLNRIRLELHKVSPFKDEPIDYVEWIPNNNVEGNDYNPNRVAPPEMKLLTLSILLDHFTQSIVGWKTKLGIIVVDGFHRTKIGKGNKAISKRMFDYLPITFIKSDREDVKDRMAATIRHNRARGVHGVLPMIDVVAILIQRGWTDDEVSKELGMDADEVLRFKQNKGLPELFKNHEYSKSWK